MLLEEQFGYLYDLILNARHKALKAVNSEQIVLYWTVGQFVEQNYKPPNGAIILSLNWQIICTAKTPN